MTDPTTAFIVGLAIGLSFLSEFMRQVYAGIMALLILLAMFGGFFWLMLVFFVFIGVIK